MRRTIAALLAGTFALLGFSGSVALADPAEAAPSCGYWGPSDGELSSSYDPQQRTWTATVSFTLKAAERAALSCVGSRSLELDLSDYSGALRGGTKSWSSNMPSAYLDTEDSDQFTNRDARALAVGTSDASSLKVGVRYTSSITLTGIRAPAVAATDTKLNFQRGHWARSISEKAWCAAHRNVVEQCTFSDEDDVYMARQGVRSSVELRQPFTSHDARGWGADRRSMLGPGTQLNPGQRLVSPGGATELVMQSDGNLVMYASGRALWASGTNKPGTVAVMQRDGNLVLVAPGNRPVWATGTNGRPGSVVWMQDDQNLVVYAPGTRPVWSSKAGRQ